MFKLSSTPLDPQVLRSAMTASSAGGFVSFEGWVRDHNEGKEVVALEYEAYTELATREADNVLAEARTRYEVLDVHCVHRVGRLDIGEVAVWIGVSAVHRSPAFSACEYVIDQIKVRVPIWKKEYYHDGDSGWVECEHCSEHAANVGEERDGCE